MGPAGHASGTGSQKVPDIGTKPANEAPLKQARCQTIIAPDEKPATTVLDGSTSKRVVRSDMRLSKYTNSSMPSLASTAGMFGMFHSGPAAWAATNARPKSEARALNPSFCITWAAVPRKPCANMMAPTVSVSVLPAGNKIRYVRVPIWQSVSAPQAFSAAGLHASTKSIIKIARDRLHLKIGNIWLARAVRWGSAPVYHMRRFQPNRLLFALSADEGSLVALGFRPSKQQPPFQ